ncbi:MAG: NAD(P)H-dependent oxidoreductase [Lachnospiraceae bacterium]|nr:NAD(P)H-dependent oxidoreductase [Lachnospiraceae bacterium]
MNAVIIYYSMSENTAYVAERIREGLLDQLRKDDRKAGTGTEPVVDVIRIAPVKAYPDSGSGKFLWGGKSAVMKEKPALQPYQFDADKYDRIIIGTPVWAWTMSPPIRSFIEENRDQLKDRQIGVFVCSGGGGVKAIGKIREFLPVDKLRDALDLIEPRNNQTEANDQAIARFVYNMC